MKKKKIIIFGCQQIAVDCINFLSKQRDIEIPMIVTYELPMDKTYGYKSVFEEAHANPQELANAIKALPINLQAFRPIDEAISSAGGVLFEVLNSDLMLEQLPGVFCAGEMLDWEAPTGGYLLNASMATGRRAALGVLNYLGG